LWKKKKKRCAVPSRAILAHWLNAIAARDSTRYANASGPKDPSVVVGGGEDVVGEAEVESETMTDLTTGRGIMAGAAEEVPLVRPHSYSRATFSSYPLCSSGHGIDLLPALARLRPVAGPPLVIVLLAHVVLLAALVLAVQFVHVPSRHLRAVGHPHREVHLLHPHHAGVAVALHRTHHVIKNVFGIVGPEDATAVAHQRVAGASAHPRVVVLLVGAQTRLVADAVQALVGVEGIAPRPALVLHLAGEGERGTDASAGAEAEAGA